MSLQWLMCRLNRHRPRRRNIEWDGRDHVALCRACEVKIRLDAKGRWLRHAGVQP